MWLTFVLVGCSSDKYSNIPEDNVIYEWYEKHLEDKCENIPEEETDTFESPVSFSMNRKGVDIPGIEVTVWGSPRFIFLPKDHPRYNELYKIIKDGSKKTKNKNGAMVPKVFKVTIHDKSRNGFFPIINIEELSPEREAEIVNGWYPKEKEK